MKKLAIALLGLSLTGALFAQDAAKPAEGEKKAATKKAKKEKKAEKPAEAPKQ